jgi:hypothetical protein
LRQKETRQVCYTKIGDYQSSKKTILLHNLNKYVFSNEWREKMMTFLHWRNYNEAQVFHHTNMVNTNNCPCRKIYTPIDNINNEELANIIYFLEDSSLLKKQLTKHFIIRFL